MLEKDIKELKKKGIKEEKRLKLKTLRNVHEQLSNIILLLSYI